MKRSTAEPIRVAITTGVVIGGGDVKASPGWVKYGPASIMERRVEVDLTARDVFNLAILHGVIARTDDGGFIVAKDGK